MIFLNFALNTRSKFLQHILVFHSIHSTPALAANCKIESRTTSLSFDQNMSNILALSELSNSKAKKWLAIIETLEWPEITHNCKEFHKGPASPPTPATVNHCRCSWQWWSAISTRTVFRWFHWDSHQGSKKQHHVWRPPRPLHHLQRLHTCKRPKTPKNLSKLLYKCSLLNL